MHRDKKRQRTRRLHRTSVREEAHQELHDSQPMPWTAWGELQKLQKGQFLDISTDIPEDDEIPWKNTPWDVHTDSVDMQAQEQQHSRKRLLTRTSDGNSQSSDTMFASSHTEIFPDTETDWSSDDTALEIQFEMKTGKHAFQETCRDLYAFVTSAAKKGRKEVFERQMSLEERRKFDPAKQKEIKNYVVNDVLEKLEPHENPPRESILRVRWVLEYRLDENENKSPKARIVILGYLDPDYENRPAASPTMTRNTRQLLLHFGAWMGFSAAKGDVSGAFLQGRNLQRDLWVLPVPELAAALDVAPGEIMKLKRAAYGLVEAPVEWYMSISTVLKEHGWRRLKSDPCCWILIDPSLVKAETEKRVTTRSECLVVAATGGHVDDFVFVGKEGNKAWETARKKLQDHYRWKMWEYDDFLQCGVRVEHQKDGSFLLSQNEFVDELREIQITSQRR